MPKNKKTLLYLHGGAYVACGAETHGPLITTLSEYSHSDVYFPIYGLAPKNPFPCAINDALNTYKYLLDNEISADKIFVAGDSAGGGLTLALLQKIREENLKGALDNKNLSEENKKDQPNEIIGTNIRLKGDRPIHYENIENSSYRFNLDNDNYYDGLSSFSLQKPRIRNYIHEWIFHEMMGDFGLIKLNYHFFHLYINGENHGLFALEEKLSKEIVERNQRRNGPIFTSVNFINTRDDPALKIYKDKYWSRPDNIELAKIATNKLSNFLRKINETR